ncbi:MAG: pyridoxamine 5'-phosphate oxidase family protein [Rhodobacteraceae bacterium]|nr:pyridoxamine 5'-phosphate oxidase family protein [Paracoccaceae bacterium]
MAKQFASIEDDHRAFIEAQHLFFVGSAAADGRVNVSPKGMDSLRVAGANRIVWLNLTGSGNETAGHLRQVNRMTLMWCGFETRPLILRAYGQARVIHPFDADWEAMSGLFDRPLGARQVYDMDVDLVQTSCGYGVPKFGFQGNRDALAKWTEDRADILPDYWTEKNSLTIDGAPTGISGDKA